MYLDGRSLCREGDAGRDSPPDADGRGMWGGDTFCMLCGWVYMSLSVGWGNVWDVGMWLSLMFVCAVHVMFRCLAFVMFVSPVAWFKYMPGLCHWHSVSSGSLSICVIRVSLSFCGCMQLSGSSSPSFTLCVFWAICTLCMRPFLFS